MHRCENCGSQSDMTAEDTRCAEEILKFRVVAFRSSLALFVYMDEQHEDPKANQGTARTVTSVVPLLLTVPQAAVASRSGARWSTSSSGPELSKPYTSDGAHESPSTLCEPSSIVNDASRDLLPSSCASRASSRCDLLCSLHSHWRRLTWRRSASGSQPRVKPGTTCATGRRQTACALEPSESIATRSASRRRSRVTSSAGIGSTHDKGPAPSPTSRKNGCSRTRRSAPAPRHRSFTPPGPHRTEARRSTCWTDQATGRAGRGQQLGHRTLAENGPPRVRHAVVGTELRRRVRTHRSVTVPRRQTPGHLGAGARPLPSPDDLRRLADKLGPDLAPLVYLGAVLGLRWGECATLRVGASTSCARPSPSRSRSRGAATASP